MPELVNSRPLEDIDFLKNSKYIMFFYHHLAAVKKSLRGMGAIFQFLKQATHHLNITDQFRFRLAAEPYDLVLIL